VRILRFAAVMLPHGGFDPLLAPVARPWREDLDMFLRIILAGGRISYLPSALVWHKHRADTAA